MSSNINASTSAGLVQTADTSGVLQLQCANAPVATFTNAGSATPLVGAVNPAIALTGSANNYIQAYLFNGTNGVNASADFTAYPNNGLDSSGWMDMGITSQTYSQAVYSVTGANEGYLFMSAPAGSSTTGNMVLATDSTGTANSIQFFTNGFNQAKTEAALTIDKNDIISGYKGSTVPTEHYVVLSSTNTLTSQIGAQPIFDGGGGPAGGAVTLPVGTYQFECVFAVTGFSATSGSFGFNLGGGAAKTEGWYAASTKSASLTTGSGATNITYNTGVNLNLGGANTATTGLAHIKGTIRITTAGTIIPQIILSVAAAAVVQSNSYFKISPISASATANNSALWS